METKVICFRCGRKFDKGGMNGYGQTTYAGFHSAGISPFPFYNTWRLCSNCSRGLESKILEYLYSENSEE